MGSPADLPAHLRRVQVIGECWVWQGAKTAAGYGTTGKPTRYVHREVYEAMVGPIGGGLFVLHTCDNPPCCNPAHLFLGTNAENLADMRAKGRGALPPILRGEASTSAKLTEADVREIRRRYSPGAVTLTALAAEYGVDHTMVSRIVRRKAWAHIGAS